MVPLKISLLSGNRGPTSFPRFGYWNEKEDIVCRKLERRYALLNAMVGFWSGHEGVTGSINILKNLARLLLRGIAILICRPVPGIAL